MWDINRPLPVIFARFEFLQKSLSDNLVENFLLSGTNVKMKEIVFQQLLCEISIGICFFPITAKLMNPAHISVGCLI